jgi:uncharacterized protein (DUF983 family)
MGTNWTNEARPAPTADAPPARSVWQAMLRGVRLRCPNCGGGRLFRRKFLKVEDRCEMCREELHHHRADDAPPYFTILLVGHAILPPLMALELAAAPPVWVHLVLWLPLTVVLSVMLLPPVKGAIVGLQWALRMHGFGAEDDAKTIGKLL